MDPLAVLEVQRASEFVLGNRFIRAYWYQRHGVAQMAGADAVWMGFVMAALSGSELPGMGSPCVVAQHDGWLCRQAWAEPHEPAPGTQLSTSAMQRLGGVFVLP